MSYVTAKSAVILQAMRKRLILPALNFVNNELCKILPHPDLKQDKKESIFTADHTKSTNPALSLLANEHLDRSIQTEIAVSALFEIATGNSKTIKVTGTIDQDGKYKPVGYTEEYHRPDVNALKFFLEHEDPANWKERQATGTVSELINACLANRDRRIIENDANN